eukprot:SAG31_NODE_2000_length_6694_cov_13.828658_3_plen_209_part_00
MIESRSSLRESLTTRHLSRSLRSARACSCAARRTSSRSFMNSRTDRTAAGGSLFAPCLCVSAGAFSRGAGWVPCCAAVRVGRAAPGAPERRHGRENFQKISLAAQNLIPEVRRSRPPLLFGTKCSQSGASWSVRPSVRPSVDRRVMLRAMRARSLGASRPLSAQARSSRRTPAPAHLAVGSEGAAKLSDLGRRIKRSVTGRQRRPRRF